LDVEDTIRYGHSATGADTSGVLPTNNTVIYSDGAGHDRVDVQITNLRKHFPNYATDTRHVSRTPVTTASGITTVGTRFHDNAGRRISFAATTTKAEFI
jgi:hypothetical protein